MAEQTINLDQLQEEMVRKIAELSAHNTALADSVEELSKDNTELRLHNKELTEVNEKLRNVCKELQEELESYQQPCKCSAPQEPEYLKPEELKLKNLYNQLDEDRWFYQSQIRDFKHAIINGEKPDFFKAKIRETKKQLKRIKKLIKHVLK